MFDIVKNVRDDNWDEKTETSILSTLKKFFSKTT